MDGLTPLGRFLAVVGPEFDAAFISEHIGSENLDDIIELTVDEADLQPLIEHGMKPLHRNKLWSAIAKEREVRRVDAQARLLFNDVSLNSKSEKTQKIAEPNLAKGGMPKKALPDDDKSKDSGKDQSAMGTPNKESQKVTDSELTESRCAAAKKMFQGVAGLLNATDQACRSSWESKFGSPSCVEAASDWSGETRKVVDNTQQNTMLVFDSLANALVAGAIPAQGQAVLLSLHTQLMGLEYGMSLADNALWRAVRTRFFSSLSNSLDALVVDIADKTLSAPLLKNLHVQLDLYAKADFGRDKAKVTLGTKLSEKLVCHLCPQCCLTPTTSLKCLKCESGSAVGGWVIRKCTECVLGKPLCPGCVTENNESKKTQIEARTATLARKKREEAEALAEMRRPKEKSKGKGKGKFMRLPEGPPAEGVTIERGSTSDLALMKKFWQDREGSGEVIEAWSIDNPLRTWKFDERRKELEEQLGRSPDELEGLHGSDPNNYLSIIQGGFRSDLRGSAVGQAFGRGEYLAKCPDVSVSYCKGGEYMLVCRLCLGVESVSEANLDGDHIWVPSCRYYVISKPEQILPIFVVKFRSPRGYGKNTSIDLEKALSAGVWSTKVEERKLDLPPPRPCMMSRPFAKVLWMGLMYAHHTDEQLESDVKAFLQRHARSYADGIKVQVVRGIFKKAHVVLTKPMPKDVVHQLNTVPFKEKGVEHNICIEDSEGSPEQKCPKWIANYCRGQNLRYTHPCWCWHPRQATNSAHYVLQNVDLDGAKGNEIAGKFMSTAPFHDGQPKIVSIKAIKNDVLTQLHEEFRKYLANKHRETPKVRELYHGTNNNILDVLYQHGCKPPSDVQASEECPVSGGKGLNTTLCNNDCKYCTEKHEWNRCHMFGLGIYLADMAQKSHRYVSQPKVVAGRRQYRMIVCSVLGRAFKVEGHLKCAEAMHDVPQVRALSADEVDAMIEPCAGSRKATQDSVIETPAEKSDMIFVEGLEGRVRPGFSVVNSEYIAFHPHQCLPKYEITYEL